MNKISVYIHIPFCTSICTYCDFPKVYKKDEWINKYLIALEKEIKQNYKNEKVKTLYFGGGTPSALSIDQLKKLFAITKIFDLEKDAEITFECNLEDLTLEKILFLKEKVNRLSIGVQTFNNKFLKVLGRKVNIDNIVLVKNYFDNINIDLMYGFAGEKVEDLKRDLKILLNLDVAHVSAYSLILEENTMLYINNYKVNDDTNLDIYLDEELRKNGYNHYEISNYAKEGYESKHNLVYWNNDNYYGFGLGASGYLGNIRYDNTRSLNRYLEGNFRLKENFLDENEKMQNEFMLGFRKMAGINKKDFKTKYGMDMKDLKIIQNLLSEELLLENDNNVFINPKYIYLSNEILVKFLERLY